MLEKDREISWKVHAKNEEVLLRIKEEKRVLYTVKRRKAIWIGHFLRRNFPLKQITKGKIKGTSRGRRRKRKWLLDDIEKTRGYCSRTLLVQQRERLLASFAGGLGPSVLNFIVNFRPGNRWIQRAVSGKAG